MKITALVRTGSLSALPLTLLLLTICKPGDANAQTAIVDSNVGTTMKNDTTVKVMAVRQPVLDTALYDSINAKIANGDASGKWPVKGAYPKAGAVLPFNRIVAYYGNFYSKQMGVLGQYPQDEVIEKLKAECKKWQAADTTLEVIPAIHYIAVTAQGSPGNGGKYRLRMPFSQIDKALAMAKKINGLLFLDVQVALSNVQAEIPQLEKYLKMPNVHLGIDPEFSMKTGKKPGSVIGTMDAEDINYVSDYLAKLVKDYNLPPKILVVHRFTRPMVTNYKKIKLQPEVQIVMDMDGWGGPSLKYDSYKAYIFHEPVQFTGFKLFYKNDVRQKNSHVLTPAEVLRLKPQPLYIQYQ